MSVLVSGLKAQPLSVKLPLNLLAQPGSQVSIPVTVMQFDSVCNISLVFSYDTTVLAYSGFTMSPAYPGGMYFGNQSFNQFRFGWFALFPFGLSDGDTLFSVHFNYLGGNTQLNWSTLPDECLIGDCETGEKPLILVSGAVVSQPATGQISGVLVYDNLLQSPLSGVEIILLDGNGQELGNAVTDNNGQYSFQVTAAGTYQLQVVPTLPWGSVNSTDALRIVQHFAGVSLLQGLALAAADVNANGYVNAGDALSVLKRFTDLISSFPSGDWVFDIPPIQMDNLTILTVNVKALFNGDVDRSYLP
ncbi:MAG TPA: dockerin type I domain-containing protein [Bacteroidales bacterium]|nr:dockerin type I domain-containing protein [Bacteroidales bacterium]